MSRIPAVNNNTINTNFKNINAKQESPEYYKRLKVIGGSLFGNCRSISL